MFLCDTLFAGVDLVMNYRDQSREELLQTLSVLDRESEIYDFANRTVFVALKIQAILHELERRDLNEQTKAMVDASQAMLDVNQAMLEVSQSMLRSTQTMLELSKEVAAYARVVTRLSWVIGALTMFILGFTIFAALK